VSPILCADAGNVLAGMIGMIIGIVLICSLLGVYARKQEGGGAAATTQPTQEA